VNVRYLSIGIFNTLFGFGVYTMIMVVIPSSYYLLALALATFIGGIESYVSQRIFVWKSKADARLEFIKFSTVFVSQFCLNAILLLVCVEIFEMDPLWAQYVIGLILVVLSYFIHRHWTFKFEA
jgi:putative flippase GtrA